MGVVNNAWYAIHKFFQLQYWTRIWIVQEVAWAKVLVLTNGRSTLDPDSLQAILHWLDIQAEYSNSVKTLLHAGFSLVLCLLWYLEGGS